jgi:hypothetical protein
MAAFSAQLACRSRYRFFIHEVLEPVCTALYYLVSMSSLRGGGACASPARWNVPAYVRSHCRLALRVRNTTHAQL